MSNRTLWSRGREVPGIDKLTYREFAVLQTTFHCRFITSNHIHRLFYTSSTSARAAARARQRTLKQLTERKLLRNAGTHIEKEKGRQTIYALDEAGRKFFKPSTAILFRYRPSLYFAAHTLALTELYVRLHEISVAGNIELLEIQMEPTCWRYLSGKGEFLKPDMFVRIDVGEEEFSYFIEVDKNNVRLTAIQMKLKQYEQYYAAGSEQATYGVYPQVLWLVNDLSRQNSLERLIQPINRRLPGLFAVAQFNDAIDYISQPVRSNI